MREGGTTSAKKGRCVAALVALLSLAATVVQAADAVAPAWRLVVHPSRAMASIGRTELERIYRRTTRFWKDGVLIVPLNLPGEDPLRRAFSDEILRDSEDELANWWNRQYFQGVMPPAVLQSSGAVRAYVAVTPGAIGYIDATDVDASVSVVEVQGGD